MMGSPGPPPPPPPKTMGFHQFVDPGRYNFEEAEEAALDDWMENSIDPLLRIRLTFQSLKDFYMARKLAFMPEVEVFHRDAVGEHADYEAPDDDPDVSMFIGVCEHTHKQLVQERATHAWEWEESMALREEQQRKAEN